MRWVNKFRPLICVLTWLTAVFTVLDLTWMEINTVILISIQTESTIYKSRLCVGLFNLGKISNCNFFDRYCDCDLICDFKFTKSSFSSILSIMYRKVWVSLPCWKKKYNRNHHRNSYSLLKKTLQNSFLFWGIIPIGITVVLLVVIY